MTKRSDLIFLIVFSLIGIVAGEIKYPKIFGDHRPLIIFEKFGFTSAGVADVSVSEATFSSSVDPSLFGFFLLSTSNPIQALAFDSEQNPNPSCILSSPYIRLLFTFRDLSPPPFSAYNRSFPVTFPGDYSLFFANCAPEAASEVSMNVRTVLYNLLPDGTRDYLSVGESPIPSVCFAFGLVFLAFLAIWIDYLKKNGDSTLTIHGMMAGLLLAKALNLLFQAGEQHYVRITGTPANWDVFFYMFQLLKGLLLFAVIGLIGTGWPFLKPFLEDWEQKLLMLVIPLQYATNTASFVIEETGPYDQDWGFWVQMLLFADLLCCCVVLCPLVWSIRSLREASKNDGKAAKNLAKLVLFTRFYVVLVGYLYFSRVVVYALKAILSYEYSWVAVATREGVSLAFYILMFYLFRPMVGNEYLALDDEEEANEYLALDDEEEAAAVVALKGDFDI